MSAVLRDAKKEWESPPLEGDPVRVQRGENTHVSLVGVVDLDQFRHVILVVFVVRLCNSGRVTTGGTGGTTGLGAVVLLCDLTEGSEGVGTELVEDVGHEVGEFLGDSVAVDGVGVGSRSGVNCKRAGARVVRSSCPPSVLPPKGEGRGTDRSGAGSGGPCRRP